MVLRPLIRHRPEQPNALDGRLRQQLGEARKRRVPVTLAGPRPSPSTTENTSGR